MGVSSLAGSEAQRMDHENKHLSLALLGSLPIRLRHATENQDMYNNRNKGSFAHFPPSVHADILTYHFLKQNNQTPATSQYSGV